MKVLIGHYTVIAYRHQVALIGHYTIIAYRQQPALITTADPKPSSVIVCEEPDITIILIVLSLIPNGSHILPPLPPPPPPNPRTGKPC